MEKLMLKNVLNKFGFARIALVAGAGLPLLFASNAFAQAPPPPPPDTMGAPVGEAVTERVIVTGSNIPTAQEQASIPVTTYTAQWLQKSGSNTPVEGLRQLPTFVGNAETENDSNAGDGTAFINLRRLGAENTLVLINGRRMAGGNGIAADINLLQLSSINKVDVLKDGASAIYGSGAVAGVVNFMMWNDIRDYGPIYEGAEFELRYGTTTDHDANVRQGWIRGGVTGLDGKVAIFAAAEYYNRAAIMSADRRISSTGNVFDATPGDNPTGATGLPLNGTNNNSPTYSGKLASISLGGNVTLIDLTNNAPTPASYRPFLGSVDPSRFNFRAFTPAIPALERSNTYVTGRYKVFGDALQVYGDMMYTHVRQKNGLAGSPFALVDGEGDLSPFNPFPAGDVVDLRYRLQSELGNRIS